MYTEHARLHNIPAVNISGNTQGAYSGFTVVSGTCDTVERGSGLLPGLVVSVYSSHNVVNGHA